MRVLITGWPSFCDGEATAGDVLSIQAVRDYLVEVGIDVDVAWSAGLRSDGLHLEQAHPPAYTHLLFVCGPVHGRQVRQLHQRFNNCRRIAVGVSIVTPNDPAVTGFHHIIARDGHGVNAHRDLAAVLSCRPTPVVGVILAHPQKEYGARQRHENVHAALRSWLGQKQCARVFLDTRLDGRDWRLCQIPDQLESIIMRLDIVVTTRMHGLVFALKNGIPALAVDPIRGGAKVSAQATAWNWPAVLLPHTLSATELDRWWGWCRSAQARREAARCQQQAAQDTLLPRLLDAIRS